MSAALMLWCAVWCAGCTAAYVAWGNPILLACAIFQGLCFLFNLAMTASR